MCKGIATNLKDFVQSCVNMTGLIKNLCVLCLHPCDQSLAICSDCFDDLPKNLEPCPACSRPNSRSRTCANCLKQPWKFIDHIQAPFNYRYPINYLIKDMKNKQRLNIAHYLGTLLAELSTQLYPPLPDCIIPVPSHPGKLITRGYNPAIEIARPLAQKLNINMDSYSCKRLYSKNIPQTGMNAQQRRRNIRNAFTIPTKISYQHVLLVDDVITTGSTIKELARILHYAGVSHIDVLACARTS